MATRPNQEPFGSVSFGLGIGMGAFGSFARRQSGPEDCFGLRVVGVFCLDQGNA